MTDPTVTVDRELCLGSGMCIVYAPETFAHDDEAKAVVVDPAADSLDALQTVVDACPTGAIRLATKASDTDEAGE
ncbi:ferredoxin [Spirillospora sp. CA-255316]